MAPSRFLPIAPIFAAGLASLCVGTSLASAEQPLPRSLVSPEKVDVDALVRSLASPSLEERTNATSRLAIAKPSVDAFFTHLKRDDLTPEQRERLTRLAWERFASTPRAALGISFQRGFVGGMESGAVIEGTFEGFDSNRVLKPGDTIYAMDDVRIHSMDEGKRVIQSREPGERVSLRIFRQGKPIIVRLTLGSLPDLDRKGEVGMPRSAEPNVLRDAFRLRLDRALATTQTSTPLNLSPHWNGVKVRTDEQAREEFAKLAADGVERPSAPTAGGRQGPIGEAQLERFTSNPGELQSKQAALVRELRTIDNRLQMLDLQIDDPNMGAERRTRAEKDRRILLERRARVKENMSALQPGRGLLQP